MDGPRSDSEVIRASLIDPAEFAGLFDRHFSDVHRFVARRLGTDRALDVAADTFAIAFDRRRTYRAESPSARPWLFGIASNLLRKERGRFARHLTLVAELDAVGRRATAAGDDESRTVLDGLAINRALGSLGPDSRELVLLVAWEGFSYEEAAESLGLPIGTVRSRLHRARQRLQAILDPSESQPCTTEETTP